MSARPTTQKDREDIVRALVAEGLADEPRDLGLTPFTPRADWCDDAQQLCTPPYGDCVCYPRGSAGERQVPRRFDA